MSLGPSGGIFCLNKLYYLHLLPRHGKTKLLFQLLLTQSSMEQKRQIICSPADEQDAGNRILM